MNATSILKSLLRIFDLAWKSISLRLCPRFPDKIDYARPRPIPDFGKRGETPVRGMEGRARDRAGGVRRSGFDRADVAGGALARLLGARPPADRGHRRPRPAHRGSARSARRQAAGAHARSAPPHAALAWHETENRITGRVARDAIPAIGASGAAD